MRERMPQEVVDAVHARAGYACEAMVPPVCTGAGEHLHHRQLRSQGGEHTANNVVAICSACHEWAHRNPRQAEARGLIVRSMHDPDTTKVRYRNGGYVLLADVDPEHY